MEERQRRMEQEAEIYRTTVGLEQPEAAHRLTLEPGVMRCTRCRVFVHDIPQTMGRREKRELLDTRCFEAAQSQQQYWGHMQRLLKSLQEGHFTTLHAGQGF